MRFALRNQDKIAAELGQDALDCIIKSLEKFLESGWSLERRVENWEGEKYPVFTIPQHDHTVNDVCFYVLDQTYDVVKLAFKEFIG